MGAFLFILTVLEYKWREKIMVTVGQRYAYDGEEYIVAQVNSARGVALICLNDGMRWQNPVRVKNSYRITPAEWDRITDGDDFILTSENPSLDHAD